MKLGTKGLHAGNSRLFRPRPVEKLAVLRWQGATYDLEWGKQTFDGPHIRVQDPGGTYGVDLQTFHATHGPVPGKPDHYVKTAPVRALQVTEAIDIATEVRGRLEGTASLQPGGWILQNPDGELYYNTAAEFERRYEPLPPEGQRSSVAPNLHDHLFGGGPKRILALDGGGIRGRLSLGVLKRIETIVGSPLSSYFDLIGGTSTGAIIATGLALGWSVEKLIGVYDELGPSVFEGEFFRRGLWRAKFPVEPLEEALERHFGDRTLASPDLKTGLAIVTKRLDTHSTWPVHNHPKGRYFGAPPPGGNRIPNGVFPLRQLVRASSAAPDYFDPEPIALAPRVEGVFVDGGVSCHNNPSLQLVLLATLKGYGFGWPLGADRLQVVSVGTGAWEVSYRANELLKSPAAKHALMSLLSLMDDCSALNEILMQWLSDSPTARLIDREIGDLGDDVLADAPLLSYLRYDPPLELDWIAENLPELKLDQKRLEALRRLDEPDSLGLLAEIGDAAGRLVAREHFTDAFLRR